jgi:hypothetical protein
MERYSGQQRDDHCANEGKEGDRANLIKRYVIEDHRRLLCAHDSIGILLANSGLTNICRIRPP